MISIHFLANVSWELLKLIRKKFLSWYFTKFWQLIYKELCSGKGQNWMVIGVFQHNFSKDVQQLPEAFPVVENLTEKSELAAVRIFRMLNHSFLCSPLKTKNSDIYLIFFPFPGGQEDNLYGICRHLYHFPGYYLGYICLQKEGQNPGNDGDSTDTHHFTCQ